MQVIREIYIPLELENYETYLSRAKRVTFFFTIIFHVTAYGPQRNTQGFWQEVEEQEEHEEQIISKTLSAVTFLFFVII